VTVPAKPASSTPPADLRLDLEVRKNLRAVVFDANAFSYGRPDLAFLEDLAKRLHTIDIETWVPEPVAWEWAQHLSEDWHKVQTATADERKRLRRAGLAGHNSPYRHERDVIKGFLKRLAAVPHLTVIPLSRKNALLALKDQILLKPPGRRESEVKTGASDSAWLRAVLDKVDGDTGRLLLVSEDKDIKAAFKEWQRACPLMRRRGQLKATMSEFTLDQGRAEHLISHYLTASLGDSSQDEGTLSFDIDAASNLERLIASSLADDEPDTALYAASLTRLTGLVGINGTYVDSASVQEADQPQTSELGPTSTQTALATVFFLADAEATVNRLYNGGDPHVDSLNYDGVLVRVPMSFDIRDGTVIAGRSEDEAAVSLPDDGYHDPGDAAADLLDTLSTVPGLTPPEEWPDASVVWDLAAGIGKTPVRLEITAPRGEWWLNVTIGTDTAELHCTYNDSAVVSDREDTFHVFPPFQVEFHSGGPASFNPLWALNQWIIARI
jgi:hypothetical protein